MLRAVWIFFSAAPTAQNSPELKIHIRNVAQDEIPLSTTLWFYLQLGCVMRPVDDVALILEIELGLSTQFTSEVLGCISWWSSKRPCNFHHVRNDGFDTIAFALNFGL